MCDVPSLPYASPVPPSLSPEQMAQLQVTRKNFAKVRRATTMALVDGWTTAIFGGLTTLLSLGSVPALVLGLGMVIIGYLQLRSTARLKRLDAGSLKQMAVHQIALGILLCAYGAYSLWQVKHNPPFIAARMVSDPEMAEIVENLAQQLFVSLYVSLMVVALAGGGLMALYYYTRRKYVHAYRDQTPRWITDLQQAGMTI